MAHCSVLKNDFPAITKETLQTSVQNIKAQYECVDKNEHKQSIPQVVVLQQLPSYDEFFARFLVPNQLCILTEAATRRWRSRQEWVCEDGSPNIDFLQRMFGDATVPVANCKSREFSAHVKQEMKMSEFLTYWQQYRDAGHPADENSLYLKDWHFIRDFPEYKAYSTCSFFRSDWMNEFWDVRKDINDDYRFVYMGPKNTWTPFHADVFRSFSWSANICGRKRWIFFPPGEEEQLKDVHNNLVYDVTSKDLEDPLKFPKAHRVQHRIEIIQHPGETIFVPSGWHHQVENLEDTISINHNWLNGCNVRQCWDHLKASLADVEQEISDCRDMDGWNQQCQTILRALTGMDYNEFFCFMASVARRRIDALDVWQQKARNSASCCRTIPRSCHDENSQSSGSLPSEPCQPSRSFPSEPCQRSRSLPSEPCQPSRSLPSEPCQPSRSLPSEPCQPSRSLPSEPCQPSRSLPSEPCLHTKDDGDNDRTSAEPPQPEVDLLNLAEGVHLNGEDQRPRHWSFCNVNHALFDLTSVSMVLSDMRRHHSESQVPETKEDNPDRGQCEQHADVTVFNKNRSEISECTEENSCQFMILLKEISQCLCAFGLEGDWESG